MKAETDYIHLCDYQTAAKELLDKRNYKELRDSASELLHRIRDVIFLGNENFGESDPNEKGLVTELQVVEVAKDKRVVLIAAERTISYIDKITEKFNI